MENFKTYIDYVAKTLEAVGVLAIFFGTMVSICKYVFQLKVKNSDSYTKLRQSVGKSILLGLEILIAADIMATIVTEPTIKSVSILGVIIFIRTFLSLSLQIELEGKFPWQKRT